MNSLIIISFFLVCLNYLIVYIEKKDKFGIENVFENNFI